MLTELACREVLNKVMTKYVKVKRMSVFGERDKKNVFVGEELFIVLDLATKTRDSSLKNLQADLEQHLKCKVNIYDTQEVEREAEVQELLSSLGRPLQVPQDYLNVFGYR
jgi:predicted nucleotidyltransferase